MTDTLTKTLRSCFFIIAFSLILSLSAKAQTCGTPPTCDSLGYKQTSSDCAGVNRVLKCPFDASKVFCNDNIVQNITLGEILYSDKTVASGIISGKTPIGIVFDANKRLAVALDQPGSVDWGGWPMDIPTLTNCAFETQLSCDTDGKANTRTIINYGNDQMIRYPVAEYCNNYKTAGTTAGDWFLPSAAELMRLYNAMNYVNASLELLSKPIIQGDLWSSTEIDEHFSFTMHNYGFKDDSVSVRAVVAF